MGTIPTPPTFVPGTSTGLAAQLNQLRDVQNFWANPPQCQAFDTAGPTLTTGVELMPVPLDGETYDIVQAGDTEMHSISVNTSRITIRTAGKYQVDGYASFALNPTGSRRVTVYKNGTTTLAQNSSPAVGSVSTSIQVSAPGVMLAVGDYIELGCLQTSGGNLALNAVNPGPARLTARLIAQ